MGFVKIRRRKPIGRIWPPLLWICPFLLVAVVFTLVDGFSVHETAPAPEIAGEDCEVVGDEHELLVTGYCNCGKCCGWRKKWFFFGEPVYDYGNLRGTSHGEALAWGARKLKVKVGESGAPGIQERATKFLCQLLSAAQER